MRGEHEHKYILRPLTYHKHSNKPLFFFWGGGAYLVLLDLPHWGSVYSSVYGKSSVEFLHEISSQNNNLRHKLIMSIIN